MSALEIVKRKREAAPGDRAALAAEIFWNYRLAECESLLGQPATAITILRRANEMAGELARAMPANAESHRLAGKGCTELARLLRTSSPGEARALAQRACEECETAVRVEPTEVIMSLDLLGNAISLLASVEDQVGQTEEALRDFRRAAEIDERLYRERPFDRRCWERLAMTQHCIARILTELGRPAEALEPFRKAIERREALVRLSPEDVKWRSDLNGSWMRLGEALEALGRTTEAVAAHRAAVACQRQVCAREPDEIAHKKCLDDQLRHLAWLLLSLGRRVEVVEIACERVGRQGHDPAVIFSAAGELAMAALLVRCEERAFLSLLGGQRATCAALALSTAHHATLLAGRRRFAGQ